MDIIVAEFKKGVEEALITARPSGIFSLENCSIGVMDEEEYANILNEAYRQLRPRKVLDVIRLSLLYPELARTFHTWDLRRMTPFLETEYFYIQQRLIGSSVKKLILSPPLIPRNMDEKKFKEYKNSVDEFIHFLTNGCPAIEDIQFDYVEHKECVIMPWIIKAIRVSHPKLKRLNVSWLYPKRLSQVIGFMVGFFPELESFEFCLWTGEGQGGIEEEEEEQTEPMNSLTAQMGLVSLQPDQRFSDLLPRFFETRPPMIFRELRFANAFDVSDETFKRFCSSLYKSDGLQIITCPNGLDDVNFQRLCNAYANHPTIGRIEFRDQYPNQNREAYVRYVQKIKYRVNKGLIFLVAGKVLPKFPELLPNETFRALGKEYVPPSSQIEQFVRAKGSYEEEEEEEG